MKHSLAVGAVVMAAVMACEPARGGDWAGAQKVIKEAASGTLVTPERAWAQKVDALSWRVKGMPAKDAVEAWLALFDEMMTFKGTNYDDSRLRRLFTALPEPEGWDELARQAIGREVPEGVAGMKNLTLIFLMQVLMNDGQGQRKTIARMEKVMNEKETQGTSVDYAVQTLRREVDKRVQGEPVAEFEAVIGGAVRRGQFKPSEVYVPDLVGMVGEAKAREMLGRVLKTDLELRFVKSDFGRKIGGQSLATARLARDMALADMGLLKRAQWGLVCDADSEAMFEALKKRFVDGRAKEKEKGEGEESFEPAWTKAYDTNGNREVWGAVEWYVTGLVAKGRIDEAVKFVVDHPSWDSSDYRAYAPLSGADNSCYRDPDGEFERVVPSDKAFAFFDKLTDQVVRYPVWERFIARGVEIGKPSAAIEKLKEVLAKGVLKEKWRGTLEDTLQEGLINTGRGQEAVALMMSRYTGPGAAAFLADAKDDFSKRSWFFRNAVRMLHVMEKVSDEATQERAVEELQGILKKASVSEDVKDLLNALVWHEEEKKRPERAEALLAWALTRSTKEPGFAGGPAKQLGSLVEIYGNNGRYEDVIRLAQEAPWWDHHDLAGYFNTDLRYWSPGEMPVLVAQALVKTGQGAKARKIIQALLEWDAGDDRVYEMLLEVDGEKALETLDARFAMDRLQERPLIWKGQLLLKLGRVDEAERILRQAIAIDPGDVDQRGPDRMKAYALLGEVLAKKGETAEAEKLQRLVRAIGMAADADEYRDLGLAVEAIKGYEEALKVFGDAYCIRFRLAVLLTDTGHGGQAAQQFEKAFELMSDSMGRVDESCTGCAGMMAPEMAQKAAEKVFTRLVKEMPSKPTVHFLLGQLRQQQGRHKEALASYREATRLDGDYLGAWQRIGYLEREYGDDPVVMDQAVFNILRLDPQGRHGVHNMGEVLDMKQLWQTLEKYPAPKRMEPDELFAFTQVGKRVPAAEPAEWRRTINADAGVRSEPTRHVMVRQTVLLWVDELLGDIRGDGR